MSWMSKLYETYDHITNNKTQEEENILWPISHMIKNAHIEVVVDVKGNFINSRTKILDGKESPTLIPAFESSAGRAGAKIAPHPLCEEIGYCASDYPKAKKEKVKAYIDQLNNWVNFDKSHPKLKAICKYLAKEKLWSDLSKKFEFPLKIKKHNGTSQKISAEKVFIRWSVEEEGNPVCGTWMDEKLIASWISYDRANNSKEGFCYILGGNKRVASNHPRFLRWPGDGSKLVSSNDGSGFTFRGRFTDTDTSMKREGLQGLSIGFDVTQKAHNALRWLISNQGYQNGEQVYVSWAVSGRDIPEPLSSSWEMFTSDIHLQSVIDEPKHQVDHSVDLGEGFAHLFNKYLAGYRTSLKPNEQIVVMGLDSATPGRMGIIYYRELLASEFLDRINEWHNHFAWPQRHTIETPNPKPGKQPIKKVIWPESTPVPRAIAQAAYGNVLKSNNTLKKNVLERILPCIADGRPFPRDIMIAAVRQASNRNLKRLSEQFSNQKSEDAEWEKHLAIACALFRGFYKRHPDQTQRRDYSMTLEEDRTTRDYLYGRLLAIAERIEQVALNVGGEKRPTTAARLMQRFADRPFSTWRNIELALQPYVQRLQVNRAGFLANRKKELDSVSAAFIPDDFISEKPLSGEFLLGYHCQKQFWANQKSETNEIK